MSDFVISKVVDSQLAWRTVVTRVLALAVLLLALAAPQSVAAQGWVLSGQVVASGGVGIPGVDIDVRTVATGTSLSLSGDVTDANGNFSATILDALAPGALYDVSFQAPPGHLHDSIDGVVLSGSTNLGVVTLLPGWIISGVVTVGGVAVVGADIDVCTAGGGDTLGCSGGSTVDIFGDTTDATGSFSLTMPQVTGNYDIVVVAPSGAPALPVQLLGQFIFANTDLGAITMAPGAFLSGRIVDDLGVGLAGIDLQAFDSAGMQFDTFLDDTDAQGNYSLLLPQGVWDVEFRQVVFPPGVLYVPVLMEALSLTANLVLPDITLHDGYHVTGLVRDGAATPVIDANLDVVDPATGDLLHTPGDNTGNLGDFDIVLPEGMFELRVDPPAGAALVPAVVNVSVAAPPVVNDLGVIVLPAGVAVSGTVVDSALAAVVGVDLDFFDTVSQVEVPTSDDDTGPGGGFSVLVVPGSYDVRFRPSFATGLAPVVIPNVSVAGATALGNVTLPPGFALTGTVLDGTTPVPGTVVSVAHPGGSTVYVFGNDTATDGTYGLRVAAGTYDIVYTPPASSGLSAHTETAVVVSGGMVIDVQLGTTSPGSNFVRGDANGSGGVEVGDAVTVLQYLFSGGVLVCLDSGDANDNGGLDISDPIYVLGYLFSSGAAPPAPFPNPGPDPTPDPLPCP